jgi:hypothetical protein
MDCSNDITAFNYDEFLVLKKNLHEPLFIKHLILNNLRNDPDFDITKWIIQLVHSIEKYEPDTKLECVYIKNILVDISTLMYIETIEYFPILAYIFQLCILTNNVELMDFVVKYALDFNYLDTPVTIYEIFNLIVDTIDHSDLIDYIHLPIIKYMFEKITFNVHSDEYNVLIENLTKKATYLGIVYLYESGILNNAVISVNTFKNYSTKTIFTTEIDCSR